MLVPGTRAIRRTSSISRIETPSIRTSNVKVERPRFAAIYEALYLSRSLQPIVRGPVSGATRTSPSGCFARWASLPPGKPSARSCSKTMMPLRGANVTSPPPATTSIEGLAGALLDLNEAQSGTRPLPCLQHVERSRSAELTGHKGSTALRVPVPGNRAIRRTSSNSQNKNSVLQDY